MRVRGSTRTWQKLKSACPRCWKFGAPRKPVAAAANFPWLRRANKTERLWKRTAKLTWSAEVRTIPTSSTVSDRTAITSPMLLYFFLKKLYPKIKSGTLAARAVLDSFKNGRKKKNQSGVQIQARLNVIKAEVRRVATLLSVSVFFFFSFFSVHWVPTKFLGVRRRGSDIPSACPDRAAVTTWHLGSL